MTYIDDESQANNAFAEYGTYVHSILEKYFKGMINFFALARYYEEHYKKSVKAEFPRYGSTDLAASYYNDGLKYFENYEDPFSPDDKVIAVEKRVNMELYGYPFVGVIDLVLKNMKTGELTIIDHKSHNFKSKKEVAEYAKQLYLYAEIVKREYGEYPTKLAFNAFRNDQVIFLDFEIEKLAEARKWFEDTIKQIYADAEFNPKPSKIFCDTICGVRRHCKHSSEYGLPDKLEDEDAD